MNLKPVPLLTGLLAWAPAVLAGPLNLLVILADDLGWADLSGGATSLGHASDFHQTPHIDRLAREGLSFTSCYVAQNCAPTRAALLSGQYPCRSGNGVYNVGHLNRGSGKPALVGPDQHEDVPAATYTLAEMLRDAGYTTVHVGKYHVGGHEGGDATLPLSQGFDHNFGGNAHGHPHGYHANAEGSFTRTQVNPELDAYGAPYTEGYIHDHLARYANAFDPASLETTSKHLVDAEVDAAVAFLSGHLSTNPERPFYLQWHSYAVHGPLDPRKDILAKYRQRPPGARHGRPDYAALLETLDQGVGRILDFLDDPNGDGVDADSIADQTLVLFLSDNGGVELRSNIPLRGCKGAIYDGGIRVPMIARLPNRIPAGRTTDTLVQHVDLYPTLLDLAGGTARGRLDGVSFAGRLMDPRAPAPRDVIFYHIPGYMDVRLRPCSVILKELNGTRYKLIYSYDTAYDPDPDDELIKVQAHPWELYNLTGDLSETTNLLAGTPGDGAWDHPIAGPLARELVAWLNQDDPDWEAKLPRHRSTGEGVPAPAPPGERLAPAPQPRSTR